MNDVVKEFVSILNPPEALEKIRAALIGGKNSIAHKIVSESITLDAKWIDEIESGLFHVEKIVRQPKSFITDQEYIVDVEKAKKINSRTVRHLAANTKNIANVEENGDIRPKRVLTIENEEELGIYENRFVAALIERLQIFVERRFKDINEKMSDLDITNLRMDSSFDLGKSKVEYNLAVLVKDPPKDSLQHQENLSNLGRIEALRKRLKILTNTEFYKRMAQLKPVRPPINKTNILKLNVDYGAAYKLWLYISAYTFVGYSVVTQDKNLPVDGDYYDDLTLLAGLAVKALADNDRERGKAYGELEAKPPRRKKYRVLTKTELRPSFRQDKARAGDDAVNEFYYNQIKKALQEAVDMPENYDLAEQKKLDLSFSKFVRTLGKINFDMYNEIIRTHSLALTKKKDGTLRGKAFDIKQQEKIYKRYLMLSQLKSAELEKALRAESREFLKLEKMKADFAYEEERAKIELAKPPKREKTGPPEMEIETARAAKASEKLILPKVKKAKEKAERKIVSAKEKSAATLERKVAESRKKTKGIKEILFEKDRKRLIEIAEENVKRKEELGARLAKGK